MKNLLFILILLTLSTFSTTAQSPCPTISITAPDGLAKIGELMTFTAKIDGNTENLKYQWTVSIGTITQGQGTLKINVVTTDDLAGQPITATIEVSGMPQNCQNSFSAMGDIVEPIPTPPPEKFDSYDNRISWREEKNRLENVSINFKELKDVSVLFRISIKGKNQSRIFKARKARIEKYLNEKHKIPKNRIKFVMGDNYESGTDIWIFPLSVSLL